MPYLLIFVRKNRKSVWLFPNRYRDRARKAVGFGRDKSGSVLPCDRRRSAGYRIEKIDFDSDPDPDPDPDKTISRQAMCQTIVLRAGDACLVAACLS